MNFPTDITQELRNCELRRKRKRALAWGGVCVAVTQIGLFIGIVLTSGPGSPVHCAVILGLTAWEAWSIWYFATQ